MSGRVVVSGSGVMLVEIVVSGSVEVLSVVVEVLSVVVVVDVLELVDVGSVVVDEVVELDVVELVVFPSSPPETTASAMPSPSTAATRSTISAFMPPLIPVDGGSPGGWPYPPPAGSPGGGTSIRRVGSSCTAADLS
jgi:hypothetical protein